MSNPPPTSPGSPNSPQLPLPPASKEKRKKKKRAAEPAVPDPWLNELDPEVIAQTTAAVVLKNADADEAQVKAALVAWRTQYFANGNKTPAEVFAEKGAIGAHQVGMVYRAVEYALKRREDKLFAKKALKKKLLTKAQLDEALAFQKQVFKALHQVKRLDKILVEDGVLQEADAAAIRGDVAAVRQKKFAIRKPANIARAAKEAGRPIDPELVDKTYTLPKLQVPPAGAAATAPALAEPAASSNNLGESLVGPLATDDKPLTVPPMPPASTPAADDDDSDDDLGNLDDVEEVNLDSDFTPHSAGDSQQIRELLADDNDDVDEDHEDADPAGGK